MCGITGFFPGPNGYRNLDQKKYLLKMSEALVHRGPNDSGAWFDEETGIGLAHQRLSIIDTSAAGHQPMDSSSGNFRVIFNGEVYNHIEIRKEIESIANVNWKSTSDTETILEAFEVWGIENSIKKFVGMFAIAVWAYKERSLYLIRDRLGEKPFYYGWQNDVFLFGSELKSLYAHPSFENKLSRKNISLFMRYSYVPDPYSVFENIYKLPPASLIKLKLGSEHQMNMSLPDPISYWSLKDAFKNGKNNLITDPNEVVEGLQEQLLNATKIQSRSDVPLGAFLSGGIDSSTVVALLQHQSSKPIKTYTIGFENEEYDEAETAADIANALGTDHTEHYVSSEEVLDVIPKLTDLYDEPFADSSQIPTFIVSKLASSEVKVSLSGDAGDELFGGYNRYIKAPSIYNYLKPIPHHLRIFVGKSLDLLPLSTWQIAGKLFSMNQAPDKIRKILSIMQSKDIDDVYARLTSHWVDEDIVLNSNSEYLIDNSWMNKNSSFAAEEKMMFQDITNYMLGDILVKLDRASMGVSLETRVPFLDHRVVEYSCRIPLDIKIRDGLGKWPLRKILETYLPKKLIQKPKMGFGIPINEMLRGPLKDWAESLLDENKLQRQGIFNTRLVRDKWKSHLTGKANYQHELWNLLMFQSWYDAYQTEIK